MKMPSLLKRFIVMLLHLLLLANANAMISVDVDKQLAVLAQGKDLPELLEGAENRVGVFTYEDPDQTGLGNDIAALVAHEILMNSPVSSIGVIRFEAALTPAKERSQSYFDKVEQLTRAQSVTLAIWGVVRKTKEQIIIDTYVQIPQPILDKYFVKELPLPAAMGGDKLQVKLKPDRFLLQHFMLPDNKAPSIKQAAKALATVRRAPDQQADVIGVIPQDQYYYFRERHRDWVNIRVSDSDIEGWLPLQGHCTDECAQMIKAPDFAGDLLAYMAGNGTPEIRPSLSTEALAVSEQLEAMRAVSVRASIAACESALRMTERWLDVNLRGSMDEKSNIRRSKTLPPGGAALANLWAVVALNKALQQAKQGASRPTWDELTLPESTIKPIISKLSQATQYDPRNQAALHNLSVLFAVIGDEKRSALARELQRK